MKKPLLLLLCHFFLLSVFGQHKTKKEELFYMLDSNFKGTTQDKATYFIRSLKENDSTWQFDTYPLWGPMLSSEKYKDDKGSVLNGRSVYFNAAGTRDSLANFENGLLNGPFYYFNDTGRVYLQKEFSKGVLIATIDRIKKDSIDEAEGKKKQDNTKKTAIESVFPGGPNAWGRYLYQNLTYPERAQQQNIQGKVVTEFVVDTMGHISNLEIIKSVEFSLDQEALRMFATSPAWIPAFQNGRKVKSYKRQPLSFKLETR